MVEGVRKVESAKSMFFLQVEARLFESTEEQLPR